MVKKSKKILIIIISLVVFVAAMIGGSYAYYQSALQPNNYQKAGELFIIESGETVTQIASKLEQRKLIKSGLAFRIYVKLHHLAPQVQAGTYNLNSYMSTPEIIDNFVTGKTKQMMLTFYPGAALYFRTSKRDTTPSHQEVLAQAGYSKAALQGAFGKNLNHPLVQKLKTDQLEGLILGETYAFAQNTDMKQILTVLFDHHLKIIDQYQLEQKFKQQGLSLYQGLILASIVEREAKTDADRQKVAQVFLTRLKKGMNLGSDVTYQYANRLAGTDNDMTIDSPYNTRIKPGLPPTPICSPSLSSLKAVASPAKTDYLYFLAGDDGKTYFAHTNSEHEANIVKHCQIGCSVQ